MKGFYSSARGEEVETNLKRVGNPEGFCDGIKKDQTDRISCLSLIVWTPSNISE